MRKVLCRLCPTVFVPPHRSIFPRFFMSSEKGEKLEHPPWSQPSEGNDKGVTVFNSLTGVKNRFLPQEGNQINWYACGPTVYSSAHLGHARAYITFDIIRRILEDYFGYDINYVMNITDVDDKIIFRARRTYLFDEYCANVDKLEFSKVVSDIDEGFSICRSKLLESIGQIKEELKTTPKKQILDKTTILKGEQLKLKNLDKHLLSFRQSSKKGSSELSEILVSGRDYLSELLDHRKGADVRDLSIFKKHSEKYEKEFLEDMRALNIRDADSLTRVTEYIPQIIKFVEKLISNGFAYESNGSVYFDIAAFRAKHPYPRLRPNQLGNVKLLNEGEGSIKPEGVEKKNPIDFALWKKSKGGEPWWESPWAQGRPGWHIECSTMASHLLGSVLDIHSGGEDLCFPHHDNEMAQSEAFYEEIGLKQWVNYFLHAGHLGIDGLKMAKSLKNFITIRQALESSTPRQVRICFLMQSWHKNMDYSTAALQSAASKDKQLQEFFLNLKIAIRRNGLLSASPQGWNSEDTKLNVEILRVQSAVHKSLRDNFDYPLAIKLLFELQNSTNTYLRGETKTLLLRKVGNYLTRMLRIFGVIDDNPMGFPSQSSEPEACLAPFLDLFCSFRDQIREGSKQKDSSNFSQIVSSTQTLLSTLTEDQKSSQGTNDASESKEFREKRENIVSALEEYTSQVLDGVEKGKDPSYYLQISDFVRDNVMPKHGVRMEDPTSSFQIGSVWKLANAETLLREQREKQAQRKEQEILKINRKIKDLTKQFEKFSTAERPFEEQFSLKYPDKEFTRFDEEHLPSHIRVGDKEEAISSKQRKKHQKDLRVFMKSKENSKGPEFLSHLSEEISKLRSNLSEIS
uniref:Cysteine--tRNA ligase, cytoplasmic n=1 Tax=Hirondellea gigas TaxID=1518452 RepID=A0A6A7G2T0_9CRUS